jgi:3-hydroxyisobutyrate dehydrogenase
MARSKTEFVGVIGLGNMGGGIARNLISAGHQVLVWDIADEAMNKFSRKATLSEPRKMVARCSIIFLVVPGTAEIERILNGRKGILSQSRRGLIIYDLTTSDPVRTKKLARRAKARNVDYLDAGMTGGATGADNGTLKLMIGGNKKAFNRSRPVLDAFTTELYHLGPSGSGHSMKLIFNLVVHTNFLVICEAGLMAEKSGIPLASMIEVINAGNARNYASERRFPDHILSGTWDARSRIYNLNKDVGMAVKMAKNLGLPVEIGGSTHKYIAQAIKAGMSEDDFSLLYKEFHNLAKKIR